MQESVQARPPAHLWIVGGLATLWNGFGCYDYVMTEIRNEAYLADFGPEATAYFDSFPAWAVAFWALGVWSALAGSLLLLARSRHAVTAYALSIAGLAVSTVYQFGMTTPPESLTSPAMTMMMVVIWAIAVALLVYARAMRARGVLR